MVLKRIENPNSKESKDLLGDVAYREFENGADKQLEADEAQTAATLLKLLRKVGVLNKDTRPNASEIFSATEDAIENYNLPTIIKAERERITQEMAHKVLETISEFADKNLPYGRNNALICDTLQFLTAKYLEEWEALEGGK